MLETLVTIKSTEPDFLTQLSGWLTVAIAAFVATIGYWQWRTAHVKLKLDLFERRIKIYEGTTAFIGSILTTGDLQPEAEMKFLKNTQTARWVFDDDIKEYLDLLWNNANRMHAMQAERGASQWTEERSQKLLDLKSWFGRQYDESATIFSKFLWIERPNAIVRGWREIPYAWDEDRKTP